MTSNACKLLCLVLSLAFVTQSIGSVVTQRMGVNRIGDCHVSDLSVTQSKTGKLVQNKPEWAVKLYNPCNSCKFYDIKLFCGGLKSVTEVGPVVILFRDLCLLNIAEATLNPHIFEIFTYAWDNSYDFKVLDAKLICS